MKIVNYKTTLTGLITAILNLIVFFGLNITPEQTMIIISSLTTIGLFVVSIFAKDKDVTGGTKQQK